jgi:hypothetical protein
VNDLLQQKAYFYVCGDAANMAREVNTVLAQIIAEQCNIPESKGEEIVKSMRSANQYQVCLLIYIAFQQNIQQTAGCILHAPRWFHECVCKEPAIPSDVMSCYALRVVI